MTKTLISATIIASMVALILGFGEVFLILAQVKSSVIYYLGMVLSRIAIFMILAELTWGAVILILKKL